MRRDFLRGPMALLVLLVVPVWVVRWLWKQGKVLYWRCYRKVYAKKIYNEMWGGLPRKRKPR